MPNGVTFSPPQPPAPLTNVLTDTHIFVGDAANVPQDVALTLNATGGAFALANTGVLTMPNADSVTRGLLTAADWITFNNKQNAIPDWTTGFGSGTQATSTWTATNAAANVNAAIIPKGTGAIVAALPDGTAVGGNARGTNAVDLQRVRTLATQVASGGSSGILSGESNRISSTRTNSFCVIGGGQNNLISQLYGATIAGGQSNTIGDNDGWQCTIGGGASNTITGRLAATIVGGNNNTASNNFVTIGGRNNLASGDTSTLMGGQSNTASGAFSAIIGGQSNTASGSHSTAIGQGSTASGTNSFAGGGGTASGASAFVFGSTSQGNAEASIAIGRNCTANNAGQRGMIAMGNTCSTTYEGGVALGANCGTSNFAAVALGQGNNATGLGTRATGRESRAELQGQISHAGGQFSAQGDAQSHELIWRRAVTGTAITELFLDGASAAAILPTTNSVWHGTIEIVAICTNAGGGTTIVGDVAAASYLTTIKRIGANTALVGGVQQIGVTNADASMSTSVFTIDANNTNESLRIQFTAPATANATTQIRVVATFRGTQIKY